MCRTVQGMNSHGDIISAWPSLSDFAADIGQAYNTAKAIRRRGRIPAWHWQSCVEGAQRRGISGVSLDVLAGLGRKPAKPSTTPPAEVSL